jgi:hypothetical protein
VFYTPYRLNDARAIKETCENASLWPNMVIHNIERCASVPFFTWCSTRKYIMVGLSSIIDCFSFFFLLSLLAIKVFNCPLFVFCLLGYDSHLSNPSNLGFAWSSDPTDLDLALPSDSRGLGLMAMLNPTDLDL